MLPKMKKKDKSQKVTSVDAITPPPPLEKETLVVLFRYERFD